MGEEVAPTRWKFMFTACARSLNRRWTSPPCAGWGTAFKSHRPMVEREAKPASRGILCLAKCLDWMIVPFMMIWPLATVLTTCSASRWPTMRSDQRFHTRARALAESVEWQTVESDARMRVNLAALLADEEVVRHAFRVDRASGGLLLGDDDLPDPAAQPPQHSAAVDFLSVDVREQPMRVGAIGLFGQRHCRAHRGATAELDGTAQRSGARHFSRASSCRNWWSSH